jgi:hypothetical protein
VIYGGLVMFGLRINAAVFDLMRREPTKCYSPAKMNGQIEDGQLELAFIFLGCIPERRPTDVYPF